MKYYLISKAFVYTSVIKLSCVTKQNHIFAKKFVATGVVDWQAERRNGLTEFASRVQHSSFAPRLLHNHVASTVNSRRAVLEHE